MAAQGCRHDGGQGVKAVFPQFCKAMGLPPPVPEHRFHPDRKWRFDYAWPEIKVALEVEGGVWSGGRHTSSQGFEGDMAKYNAASVSGWRILRVQPRQLCTLRTAELIRSILPPP
jgi:hypothetical protein